MPATLHRSEQDQVSGVTCASRAHGPRKSCDQPWRALVDALWAIGPGRDAASGMVESFLEQATCNPRFLGIYTPGAARSYGRGQAALVAMPVSCKADLSRALWTLVRKGSICPQVPLDDLASLIMALFDGSGMRLAHEPMVLDDQDLWRSVVESLRPLLGQAPSEPFLEEA